MLRFAKPEGLAALALFASSDGAATITGAAPPRDGGRVAQ